MNEDDEVHEGNLKQVKEFGIGNEIRYKRFMVNIDKSSNSLQFMSTTKDPNFVEEVLYLKLLVEGSANLYYYQDSNLRRFFYSTDDENPKQLVYKKYKENQKIKTNEGYKKQLLDILKCDDIGFNQLKSLDYYKKELTSFFNSYNICKNNTSYVFEKKNKGKLSLWAKLGYLSSDLDLEFRRGLIFTQDATANIGSSSSIYFGFELEYVLPFNNNKWSVFFAPSYQSYNQSSTFMIPGSAAIFNEEVDYKYINLLFGARHYFFLSDKSRLFVNAGYAAPVDLGDSVISDREIASTGSLSFGIGYSFNGKLNAEVRYETGRDLLNSFEFRTISTNFSSLGLILGYNFL